MVGKRFNIYLGVSGLLLLVMVLGWPASTGPSNGRRLIQYNIAVTPFGEYVVATDLPDGNLPLGWIGCQHRQHGQGLVCDRVFYHTWSLDFQWDTTPSSRELVNEARAAVVAQLVADGHGTTPGFSAQKLTAGDYRVRTHSVLGYVIDGVACILLLGVGVLWVQGLVWASRADARDAMARLRHVCLNCGYDTRGLRSTKCPECGERV